jgi:MYXO-CTERM domain-containing protein
MDTAVIAPRNGPEPRHRLDCRPDPERLPFETGENSGAPRSPREKEEDMTFKTPLNRSNVTRRNRLAWGLLLSAATAVSATSYAPNARACGGLFCNAAQPVNQAAERILFSTNDDGTVTAVIEIQYEGPAQEFAWVLPVPAGQVDVGVGSTISLDRIEAQSNPLYILNVTTDPSCFADNGADPTTGATGATPRAPGVAQDSAGQPNVVVVASGTAGPYDYEQISVNPALDDPAQVAVDWLIENNYDVGELGPDVLRPYLEQEMNLLAFRLTKNSDTGSIRPIRLKYESDQPFIPLRPTAVAANPDMGIKVWVLGDSRAIPQNYRHLELNEARLDWFNSNATYNDVVIAAADEAGGQGFVTEQAGPAANFTEAAYATWEQDNWDNLRTGQFGSLEQFFQSAVNVFGSYDGFVDVIADSSTVPLREGATAAQFIGCVSCYFQVDVPVRNEAYPPTSYDPETDPLTAIDVATFLAEMNRLVISPLADTRTMFEENSTVTRFYTTMSADEMTEDPAFDYNPELEDVSNTHTANQVMQCNAETEWRIELEQGIVLEGNGRTWPVTEDSAMPFNLRILQLSTSGEGNVVEDNAISVGEMLVDLGIGSGTEELLPLDLPTVETDDDITSDDADDASSSDDDGTEAIDAGAADDADDGQMDDDDDDATPTDDDSTARDDDDDDSANGGDAGAASDDDDDDANDSVSGDADDDGCGCVVAGKRSSPASLAWLGLLGGALFARRRRASASVSPSAATSSDSAHFQ